MYWVTIIIERERLAGFLDVIHYSENVGTPHPAP